MCHGSLYTQISIHKPKTRYKVLTYRNDAKKYIPAVGKIDECAFFKWMKDYLPKVEIIAAIKGPTGGVKIARVNET